MYFTVEKALKMPSLQQVEVIAGKKGLNRVINSVSIMDHPDTSWIKRGDFLLTTGYVFKDDKKLQINLVKELAKRGCAGMAIKLRRFLPEIPPEMIEEANQYRLPLLELPFEAILSDLLFSFTHEIVNRENLINVPSQQNEVFKRILSRNITDSIDVHNQLSELGFDLESPYIILLLKEGQRENQELHSVSLVTQLNKIVKSKNEIRDVKLWLTEFDGHLIILQGRRGGATNSLVHLAERFAYDLAENLFKEYTTYPIAIGISKEKKDVHRLQEGYLEANQAIQLGSKINFHNPKLVYDYRKFEVDTLINQVHKDFLTQYVDSTLLPVIEYDRETGGELLKTLEIYLSYRGKVEDTARALFVHRNTVKFRLSRIEELLGLDLKDGDSLFKLQLSIRAVKLL